MTLEEIISNCPKDVIIGDNLIRAYWKINDSKYKNILCSVSGGADSDIVIDICTKMDNDKKITYIWFDTGLEYEATKEHLKYLEKKYNIEIKIGKAIKPIPVSCKQYGQPFLSKRISDYISRLQKHNFQWEDEPYEKLVKKYCQWNEKRQKWIGCDGAIKWWCNAWGENSRFNISRNKWLKEFIIQNPPNFLISDKCCTYAKKKVGDKYVKELSCDLHIIGVRKSEGGNRATSYKSCFDENSKGCDNYRPLFWYLNDTKIVYENHYGILHSKCYTEYGLKRTGCAGCPFGRDFEFELKVIEKHEPKLYKAVNNIFGDSFEYTRQYKNFCIEKEHRSNT